MPLSDNEADAAYQALVAAARQVGLEWIAVEVEEQAAVGRVELRTLTVDDSAPVLTDDSGHMRPPGTRKRSKATFNVARPLTPQEKLRLLAESLNTGVVELNSVAESVLTFLGEQLGRREFVLAPEAGVKPIIAVSASDLERHRVAVSQLAALLDELKQEV
jgi:hypothetical protein